MEFSIEIITFSESVFSWNWNESEYPDPYNNETDNSLRRWPYIGLIPGLGSRQIF